MFEPLPELASDLEWMLQSGQVSLEILAEALVHEHYAEVYHLALALLDDKNAARQAARQTFVTALLNIYRYRGEEGILSWLYTIAIEACRPVIRQVSLRRTLKATFPWLSNPADFGDSLPETELDANAWLAIDALPEPDRLALLMRYILGWSDARIAAILLSSEAEASAQIDRLRQHLLTTLWVEFRQAGPENRQFWLERLDKFLFRSLQTRWPTPEFTSSDLDRSANQALGFVRRIKTQIQIKSLTKEMVLVGLTILVIFGAVWGANRLWPEPASTPNPTVFVTRLVVVTRQVTATQKLQATDYHVLPGDTLSRIADLLGVSPEDLRKLNRIPPGATLHLGQVLLNPARLAEMQQPSATPLPAVSLPPIMQPSESADFILQFFAAIRARTFQTVWLDVQFLDFGPIGYIGPPRANRAQVWLGQDQFLVLYGDQNQVEQVWLHTPQATFEALPAEKQSQFLPSSKFLNRSPDDFLKLPVDGILDPRERNNFDTLSWQVEGLEKVISRPTIILSQPTEEIHLHARLWLDASTGLVLRKQIFSSDGQTLLNEMRVTQIVYNIDFPQQLFDPQLPWRGDFAQDYTGEPIPLDKEVSSAAEASTRQYLEYLQPPSPLNLATSKLTFQYPYNKIASRSINAVDLFADGYYLGSTFFGDPWATICDRSPDGLEIAFLIQSVPPSTLTLHWINLSRPWEIRSNFIDRRSRQFAFAPDSTRLAIFGQYDAIRQNGSLYILDIQTNKVTPLSQYADVKSLVWSPDGTSLAFIARLQPNDYQDFMVVVDTQSGRTTYQNSVDFESNAIPDWPTLKWGVQFPVEMDQLQQCALPDNP
jgi:RNA polymerase sigma-70 factor (ECF subfamily)